MTVYFELCASARLALAPEKPRAAAPRRLTATINQRKFRDLTVMPSTTRPTRPRMSPAPGMRFRRLPCWTTGCPISNMNCRCRLLASKTLPEARKDGLSFETEPLMGPAEAPSITDRAGCARQHFKISSDPGERASAS
jgi:hypothetical protein